MMFTTDACVMADTELVQFLRKEVDRTSLRDVEEKTKVSRGSLERLLNKPKALPSLRTLQKLARAYDLPMWRIVEMTGYDLNLPQTSTERARRLVDLADRLPQYEKVIDRLFEMDEEKADMFLLYFEIIDRRRRDQDQDQDHKSEPDDLPHQ
jgi:transcriptional regulator with XRE-family HTH domain